MKDKINVLGTEYAIILKNDEEVCKDMGVAVGECGGYCNGFSREIVISNLNKCVDGEEAKKAFQKVNMRHEITHAFLNESGLGYNANGTECWAKNEEMVDWFAIQSPKIYKVFAELDIL
ncbi:hypothetical protein AALA00_14220 [Lachnospiraceae bacterium 46-15]